MTDQEHTQSLRQRLEAAKAERKAQDQALEDLDALLGRDSRAKVEPGQMRAAEAAFEEALAAAEANAPEPATNRPVVRREELRVPSFALFA